VQITKNTIISAVYNGAIEVSSGSTLELTGIVTGDIQVDADCVAYIKGIVNGSLYVAASANVEVRGTINGTVNNDGGNVRIFGIVDRVVTIKGDTFLDAGAIIRNK
jgi:Protein of unknown function, DUF583.